MQQRYIIRFITLLLLVSNLFFSNYALAAKSSPSTKPNVKVVIHVTNGHKRTYQAALNYTYSLREEYGDNIDIQIVANGPGIGFVNSNNQYTEEIQSLLKKGVNVSACNTTVKIMRNYQKLPIIEGVKFVPTGVVEVIKLQSKGYLYLHP